MPTQGPECNLSPGHGRSLLAFQVFILSTQPVQKLCTSHWGEEGMSVVWRFIHSCHLQNIHVL